MKLSRHGDDTPRSGWRWSVLAPAIAIVTKDALLYTPSTSGGSWPPSSSTRVGSAFLSEQATSGSVLDLAGQPLRRLQENESEGSDAPVAESSDSKEGVIGFVALCFAAMVAKLAASVDDVVWLSPFVAGGSKARKLQNGALYIMIFQGLTCVAFAVARFATFVGSLAEEAATDGSEAQDGSWGIERILEMVSGILLLLYAAHLIREAFRGGEDGDDDQVGDTGGDAGEAGDGDAREADNGADGARHTGQEQATNSDRAPEDMKEGGEAVAPTGPMEEPRGIDLHDVGPVGSSESGNPPNITEEKQDLAAHEDESARRVGQEKRELGHEKSSATATAQVERAPEERQKSKRDAEFGPRRLAVVAVLGGLDDLCVQASLLLAGTFELHQMLIGVLLGCSIVLSVCCGATAFSPVIRAIEKIPLWAIVAVLAIYTILSALINF